MPYTRSEDFRSSRILNVPGSCRNSTHPDRQEVETVALFHLQRLRLQAFLLRGFLLHRFLGQNDSEWLTVRVGESGESNPPKHANVSDSIYINSLSAPILDLEMMEICCFWKTHHLGLAYFSNCGDVDIGVLLCTKAARFRQWCSHVTHIHPSIRSAKDVGTDDFQ